MSVIRYDSFNKGNTFFSGLSTDTKPVMPEHDAGSVFFEENTLNEYVWNGFDWVFFAAGDWSIAADAGLIPGVFRVNKYGENADIDTTGGIVWDNGPTYTWLDTASVLTGTSTEVADNPAGAGARAVVVVGLDADYNFQSEMVPTNGTGNFVTTHEFLRNYRSYTIRLNVGDISISAGADLQSLILAGNGTTLMTTFTVRAGCQGHMSDYWASMLKDTGQTNIANISLWQRLIDGSERVAHKFSIEGEPTRPFSMPFKPRYVFPEKTDIWIRAVPTVSNAQIGAGFNLYEVEV